MASDIVTEPGCSALTVYVVTIGSPPALPPLYMSVRLHPGLPPVPFM
jgi:hypothetical protein